MQTDTWYTDGFRHGLFNDFNQLTQIRSFEQFPNADWLNQHFLVDGFQFLLEQADEPAPHGDLYYEEVIFTHRQIPTRADNWHDFFNAFVWHRFPRTKALLNRLHMEDIQTFGVKPRSKRRNAITLFDECGIVMAIAQQESGQLHRDWLRDHQWQQSFVTCREDWFKAIRPFMFGHANYQMGLRPFAGLTGKALFVEVDENFFHLGLAEQYQQLDNKLCKMIELDACLDTNQHLSPMPFLGIPSWYTANESNDYYLNLDYFRPKRKRG